MSIFHIYKWKIDWERNQENTTFHNNLKYYKISCGRFNKQAKDLHAKNFKTPKKEIYQNMETYLILMDW